MLRSDNHACNHDAPPAAVITAVVMPQMGLEVSEATVLEVLVAVGAQVRQDDPLLEVETEKATTEVVAPRKGFVLSIDVQPGQVVAVGGLVARVGDRADEPLTGAPTEVASGTGRASAAAPPPPVVAGNGSAATATAAPVAERLRAAPIARRAAADLGVALESVSGSGPRGRITLDDVKQAAASVPAAAAPSPAERPDTDTGLQPLSGVRRAVARRMTASQLIPQYQLQRDIDASHLLAQKDARAAASPSGARAGVNDLLMQAIAEMVVRHPALATVFVEGPEPALRRHVGVAVGLAVATDRGLVVPVIDGVERIGLGEIAAHRRRLVTAARAGTLSLQEMSGGAITLSNLAGFGVDRFTAMLNPGESAIVAVGRIADRVVPRGRGVTVVPMLTLSVSFDHRTVDGAVGGAALAELADLLEGGMTWRP
jgi:pyruvate dehydrogenase E2 component (dihydrolipoamide acetyltransferase)